MKSLHVLGHVLKILEVYTRTITASLKYWIQVFPAFSN